MGVRALLISVLILPSPFGEEGWGRGVTNLAPAVTALSPTLSQGERALFTIDQKEG